MKEYIEREALMEEIKSLRMTVTGLREGKGVLNEYATHYRDSVLRITDEQPAADVVEVIRCEDCLYWIEEEKYCHNPDGMGAIGESTRNNFCSYGKRREEDAVDQY